jgi:beta-lactamase class A
MTSTVAEKPRLKEAASLVTKLPLKKKKKLPPGQRLILYAGLSGLVLLGQAASTPIGQTVPQKSAPAKVVNVAPAIPLTYHLDELKEKLALASTIKGLRAGVFVFSPQSERYVDLNGRESYAAASMIKVPILVSLLVAMDQGLVNPDQMMEIRQDLIAGGSGWLQWRQVGSKISLRETAELMIIISDNTATNMIIDLLGGKDVLNQQFVSWGLTNTKINNWLADFKGTNTTSPYDMVYLLSRIDRGEIISPDSKKWMDQIMSRTRIRTLLPMGLPPGTKIAHKTGDIGMMVGDCGVVTCQDGKKYVVSVQVERPFNDRRANLLIRSLSKMIYGCFSSDSKNCAEVPVEPLPDLSAPAHPVRHHRRHHRH